MSIHYFSSISIWVNPKNTPPMQWKNFCNIVDKILLYFPIKTVKLLGTEPLLWEHFNDALIFLQEKKIQLETTSSGEYPFKILPYKIHSNYNYYLQHPDKQNKIKDNLKNIIGQGCGVDLLYFFEETSSIFTIHTLFEIALDIGARPIIVPKHSPQPKGLPYKHPSIFVKKLEEILKHIRSIESFKHFYFRFPTPLCMGEYIENNTDKFIFSCQRCIFFAPSFQEDGRSISFCPYVSTNIDFRDYTSMIQLETDLKKLQKNISKKNQPLTQCSTCKYYQKECKGGCLAEEF